jgi:hypothetical protein
MVMHQTSLNIFTLLADFIYPHFPGLSLALCLTGGIAFLSVVINSIRMRASAVVLLTLLIESLYASTPNALTSGSQLIDLCILLAGASLVTAIFAMILKLPVSRSKHGVLRDTLRLFLAPSKWPGDQDAISPKDYVKRWFVAISAATGCAVGVLFAIGDLLNVLEKTISPLRFLVVVLFTIATIILVGPFEEYVLGERILALDEHSGVKFESYEDFVERLWQRFSWRQLGRFLLLVVLALQLNLLHSSLENAAENPEKLFVLLSMIIEPLATSYYWCAALQLRGNSVSQRAGWAMVSFNAVIVAGTAVIFVLLLGAAASSTSPSGNIFYAVTTFVIAEVILALCFSAIWAIISILLGSLTALAAFVGGLILDFSVSRRSWNSTTTTVLVGTAVLLADSTFWAAFWMKMPSAIPLPILLAQPLSIVGWTVGLLFSGFPQIVRKTSPSGVKAVNISWNWKSRGSIFIALALLGWFILLAVPVPR